MNEAQFETLLHEGLAPPERGADRAFTLKVERAVAEADLYRLWRGALLRQFASEGLAMAAIAASLATLAHIPGVRSAIDQAPGLIWPLLLMLFLLWLLVRGRGRLLT
jgi:hypothetical protein